MDRILIADDEARIRHLIRKYAEFQGYEVAEASDGLEAVEMCRGQDFDVIVLDIMMPELDGFSACKEIRKTRDIPVIMPVVRNMTNSMDLSWASMIMWGNLFLPRN